MPKRKPITIPKQKIFNIIVTVVLAILAFFTYTNIIYTTERFDSQGESQFNRMQDITYDYYKLQFCYEHAIHPCDDISLEAWNAAHPDDTFGFMTPSQLHGSSTPPLQ